MALSEKLEKGNLLLASYKTIANNVELSVKDILSNTSLQIILGVCEKLHCSPEIFCDVIEALVCGISKNFMWNVVPKIVVCVVKIAFVLPNCG